MGGRHSQIKSLGAIRLAEPCGSAEIEHGFQRRVHVLHLVEREVPDRLAERACIDSSDHLAHHARCLLADLDFRMKARRRRGDRGRTHDDRREREAGRTTAIG